MYGYVVPYKPTLSASDFVLYRAFYCGICCATGSDYGQLPRFTTNYDFAFLSALLHDVTSADIVIEEHTCVLNPIKKKATLMPNPLLSRLAAANIMLAYEKALDGIADGDGIKYKAARRMLSKPYKKAAESFPDVASVVEVGYRAQSDTEKRNEKSVDRAADAFASMLSDLALKISNVETNDNLKSLCYNIGKFVYLADALDDIADDVKKNRYNPFIAAYGVEKADFAGRKQFIKAHYEDLEGYLDSCLGRAIDCLENMRFTQSKSLIYNIVCDGIKTKIEELLNSDKKLPAPRI